MVWDRTTPGTPNSASIASNNGPWSGPVSASCIILLSKTKPWSTHSVRQEKKFFL